MYVWISYIVSYTLNKLETLKIIKYKLLAKQKKGTPKKNQKKKSEFFLNKVEKETNFKGNLVWLFSFKKPAISLLNSHLFTGIIKPQKKLCLIKKHSEKCDFDIRD